VKRRGRELTPEEASLWRKAAATVKPKRRQAAADEVIQVTSAPPARAKAPRGDPPPAAKPQAKPRPPADRGAEKRVRRGQLDVGATLDLHGHTQASAYAALNRFLRAAQKRGVRTALVVTGVGRAGEGVLKRRFRDWLNEPEVRALISGYAQAHRTHGGAGAFYVFVKRAPETPA